MQIIVVFNALLITYTSSLFFSLLSFSVKRTEMWGNLGGVVGAAIQKVYYFHYNIELIFDMLPIFLYITLGSKTSERD